MTSWFHQLEAAKSLTDVVSITRDFMATLTPEDLARIPPSCRPGRIHGDADIEELHANAVQEYRDTRASGDELTLLQQMTTFLMRACVRMAQIRGDEAQDPEDDDSRPPPPRRMAPSAKP
jgi:hypothetical protein